MTLGLLTAFFFVWIADTISAALRVMAAGEITLSGLFILLPSVFVISAIVFIAGKNVLAPTERQDPVSTTAATRYCAIRPGMRLAINIAFLASFGLMLCYLLPSAMAGAESDVIITGKLTAISAIIAGILLLCRDIRYLIGAFTAVFVTSLVTLGEAVPDDGLRLALVLGFSVFFLIFGLASTIYSNNIPDRPEGPEFRIQLWTVVVIAAALLWFAWSPLQGDWSMATGAAMASCTLWWVKEFGSDMPNVYQEIAAATAKRPENILGDSTTVDGDYILDARMDARTDGLFYFAGAWMAAGVLSDTPALAGSDWHSDSEFFGLIIFLGIFLFLGKRWAFRQQALDLSGLRMASRLAVFHAALRIDSPGGGNGPLDQLREFARGSKVRCFDHLIIFGAPGSGRSALGSAIVSEAALTHLPTITLPFRRKEKKIREARFIQACRLPTLMRDLKTRTDITAVPPVRLEIDKKTHAVRIAPNETTPASHEPVYAADLVVIDDVTLENGALPAGLVDNLSLDKGQATVWMLDDRRFGPASQQELDRWKPDCTGLEDRVAAITSALKSGDPSARIAIGFTRRFSSQSSP